MTPENFVSAMSAARPYERSRRIRPGWCVIASAICVACILAGAMAEKRFRALRQAEAEERQQADCEAVAAREHQAGMRALAIGDRTVAGDHFKQVNRWNARADYHMRARSQALRYWW
jgi:hypothetical protein